MRLGRRACVSNPSTPWHEPPGRRRRGRIGKSELVLQDRLPFAPEIAKASATGLELPKGLSFKRNDEISLDLCPKHRPMYGLFEIKD
jgi:hypothetical protein